ncbi:hypothetical protein Mth01_39780 [Sphaerimonospora thailandensis]|uniref:Uncharacterized protein n=1 Tax=Sphaerimonospora thailandensis TaxID=795644 RepID=A0A8J3RBC6_9ACTN|nr:hypothetical protein Mth01_39780 [Sphaerimonospora thailandensis]
MDRLFPLVRHRQAGDSEEKPDEKGGHMAKRARKSKARKKKKANHGKRPTGR